MQLLIVAWLPGAVIFRLPWLERAKRAALEAEERWFWAVMISLSLSLSIVLALAAVRQYSFERLLLADVAVAAAAAAGARFRLRLGAGRPGVSALVPLVLVATCVWRFFPPAEYIIGGKDPGTYISEGIQIAQHGSLVIQDPVVASVPSFARDLFFPSHQQLEYYGLRFMGFLIQDPETGAVVGQFPHLLPASIAIGYGLDGLTGARRVVGVWAMLGVLAVYFTGARLLGRATALAAAGLLTLHVIVVWFSRYPNAEVVMLALLVAALLANARAHVDGDPFFAPLAGMLLGLLLFLRFDAVLGIAGVAAGLVLGVFNGNRPRTTFLVVFAAIGLLAVLYLFGPMRAYLVLPRLFLSNLPAWQYVALGALAGLAPLSVWAASRHPGLRTGVVDWTPRLITAGVLAGAAYAFLLRHPGGLLTLHDAHALRMFTEFYLTVPALAAALIGFGLASRRVFWHDPAFFATVAIFSFFVFYKIRIVPEHFWAARRFVPVILPATLLFAAAAAFSGARDGSRGARTLRALVGIVFVSLLGLHYARASRPLVNHVEYAGLIPKVEQLAAGVGDDDLLVAESRDAGSDIHVLALPLAYIYARQVLVLNSARPDKPVFAEFLQSARARYRRVLFAGGGGTALLSYRYGVQPLASERFQVPEYDSPRNAYPRFARAKEFDFGLYEFTPPQPRGGLRFDLDVGVRDDLHVLRFHAKEQSAGRSFRWTRATSYVSVTVINPASRDLTIWMSNGGRPAGVIPCDVNVSLHNQLLGTVRVGDGFAPYQFTIPPELAARAAAFDDPVELTFAISVWNPHKQLGSPDDRDLGVMVDRVAVR